MRDLLWGVGALVVGATVFTVFFQTRIDRVDIVAMDDVWQARTQTAEEADVWITDAATATFGAGIRIVGSDAETVGKRVKVTADTDRGDITGWWPEKHLEQAWRRATVAMTVTPAGTKRLSLPGGSRVRGFPAA